MRFACAIVLAAATFAPAQEPTVPFAEHGRAFLKALGETTAPDLQTLLAGHYTRMQLADFELCVPNSMVASKDGVARAAAIAGALVELQERLAEWLPADADATRAELKTLTKWIATWRRKPESTPPADLQPHPDPCVLIVAPDRAAFVGFVGWLGLWKDVNRELFWFDAAAQFCDLRLVDEGQVQLIALEYAAPDQDGDVTKGFAMDTRERTGLLQHVLQRAATSWCWRFLGDHADPCFDMGFATALVVDVLGQNNARSGGSGKSHSTEGQGGFIPGAPAMGGGMPVQNADSEWRKSQGSDWFARPLRQAQKAGAHEAKRSEDKLGSFLVCDRKNTRRHLVQAPFLGSFALQREAVPAAFLDDYLEFHRAYRAAFVHWLATFAEKPKQRAHDRFAVLLQRLVDRDEKLDYEALCQDVYGLPLSAADPAADSLERRFLGWLAKSN
ncbi:MAG: hypothetical protein KDE27_27645 [Planctomycetes bacterium]|nr:hypothetical protein [Planctomycetota bacterium]